MKKVVYIEGVYPINTRSTRIVKTLKQRFKVSVIAWDRLNLSYGERKENYYIYYSHEGYGNKLKKLFGMWNYFKFVKKIYFEIEPEIIFVSQWDMLIFGYLLKRKNILLVYDNIDMPSNSNFIIEKILKKIEKICLKKCDFMIYASRFFKKNYSCFNKKDYILENLPLKKFYKKRQTLIKEKKIINFGFIGTVRYFEILKNIIDVVSDLDYVIFFIYGSGPDEKKLIEYVNSKKYKNIKFKGKYVYEKVSDIYNLLDIVWAAYPNKDTNVIDAISNKFFESLVYEKPTFFSKNTKLGDLVQENKIGFLIDPYNPFTFFKENNYERLQKNIDEIKKAIQKYNKEKKIFWEDIENDFLNYFLRSME